MKGQGHLNCDQLYNSPNVHVFQKVGLFLNGFQNTELKDTIYSKLCTQNIRQHIQKIKPLIFNALELLKYKLHVL